MYSRRAGVPREQKHRLYGMRGPRPWKRARCESMSRACKNCCVDPGHVGAILAAGAKTDVQDPPRAATCGREPAVGSAGEDGRVLEIRSSRCSGMERTLEWHPDACQLLRYSTVYVLLTRHDHRNMRPACLALMFTILCCSMVLACCNMTSGSQRAAAVQGDRAVRHVTHCKIRAHRLTEPRSIWESATRSHVIGY